MVKITPVDLIRWFVIIILQNFFPAMTKIVGTLGPKSRSVEVISGCLKAGMSGTIYCYFRFYSFLSVVFSDVVEYVLRSLFVFSFNIVLVA